eukprot:364430-Chlamydomonas_euryale.AAC.2
MRLQIGLALDGRSGHCSLFQRHGITTHGVPTHKDHTNGVPTHNSPQHGQAGATAAGTCPKQEGQGKGGRCGEGKGAGNKRKYMIYC